MNHSFNVEIAEKYGIEKAVLLENFYFWIKKNKANKKNLHEGRCYTYNTAETEAEKYQKSVKICPVIFYFTKLIFCCNILNKGSGNPLI